MAEEEDELLREGIRLPGGNVGGAWLIGDKVHRDTGPWTPAVHALLRHLRQRMSTVPHVYGKDSRGREVLSYLPGDVVDLETDVLTDGQLVSLVRWTRQFHDVVHGFEHPGPWRSAGDPDATIIAHNDIAGYNACFEGDELVGVFDWDLAGPSTPLRELAFVAWNGVPLWRDMSTQWTVTRLRAIAYVYGAFDAAEILRGVPGRIQAMLDWIPRAASTGDQGMVALIARGEPERSRTSLAALERRIPSILQQL